MRRPTCAVLMAACALSSLSATAVAQPGPQRVAVLRLDFEGDVPEAARDLLLQRMVEGLAVAQFEVFAGATVLAKLTERGVPAEGCRDGSCYPEVSKALGVGYLVTGRVVGAEKNYEIALELINGRSGGSIGQKRERCELCGIEEVGEKMELAASSLRERLEALARGPARFVIRSRPVGARVSIDGRPAGRTPVDTELGAGQHQLALASDGYEASERSFFVVSGVDETLDIELVPVPERFPFRAVGWTGLALGTAAIAAGVAALLVDGNEIPCGASQQDPAGECPYVRNTSALGAALIGVGAAGVVGGGISVYLGTLGGARRASEKAGRPGIGLALRMPLR